MCVRNGFTIEVYGFMHIVYVHFWHVPCTHDVNREMEVDLMGYRLLVVSCKSIGKFQCTMYTFTTQHSIVLTMNIGFV